MRLCIDCIDVKEKNQNIVSQQLFEIKLREKVRSKAESSHFLMIEISGVLGTIEGTLSAIKQSCGFQKTTLI